jgi:cytochrome c biogenesis protein CcmG, thiol:disulfide interchange protein DsbE
MQKVVETPQRPDPPPKPSRLVLLPVAFFACVALLFGLSLRGTDPSKLPSALLGKAAPVTTLPPLAGLIRDGQPIAGVSAGDLARGEVTVVNFWASWCGPCVQEHPLLIDLKKRTNIRLIGINHKDPEPGGLRFLARLGNPFDAVGVDGRGRAAIEWGVYGMPETFVLDGQGRIAFKHVGPLTADIVAAQVLPAIAAASKAPPAR